MALETTRNLVVNGDCETGPVAPDYSTQIIPTGWTVTGGFTGVSYGAGGALDLNGGDSLAVEGGVGYFAGGPNSAFSTAIQTIGVSTYGAKIDSGVIKVHVEGDFGGYAEQDDAMSLTVTCLAANGITVLGQITIGGVNAAARGSESLLLHREGDADVPVGTRFLKVELDANRVSGAYNDAYADNISVTLVGNNLVDGLLLVKKGHDYSADSIGTVDGIAFRTAGNATATFAIEQFGPSLPADPTIVGNLQNNTLAIDISPSHGFNGSAFVFERWNAAKDKVVLNGSGAADLIWGTSQADTINGGDGADRIDVGQGGTDIVNAGANDDNISCGIDGEPSQNFSAAMKIDGGAGNNDTLTITGDYGMGVTFNATTVKNVEAIIFGEDFNYRFTLNDGTAAAGATLAISGSNLLANTMVINGAKEKDGILHLFAGSGDDTLTGGEQADWLSGGEGADTLKGGLGADSFFYVEPLASTGPEHDRLIEFNGAEDRIDISFSPFNVNTLEAGVNTGQLRAAKFDKDLKEAIGNAEMHGHNAVLFTPDSGNLAGSTFLVIDVNGTGGYQAGQDLVIELFHATNLASFTIASIID